MNVLILAAHPDDEVLGCGGMMARHFSTHEFYCMFMADGVTSRNNMGYNEIIHAEDDCRKALKLLGVNNPPDYLRFADATLDYSSLLTVCKRVESRLRGLPTFDYVFTHHPGDLNIDHRVTSQVAQTVFRPQPGSACKALLFFEVPSSTGWASGFPKFRPNVYVDISNTLETKIDALVCYEKEMRDPPHPRSYDGVRTLAKYRGNVVGYEAAEAFEVHYLRR